MAGLSTGAGAPVVMVYHEKSMILPDVSRVLACLYEKDVKFECVKDSYKDILRLQASRSVPVPFYDGPTFLQESRAICRYIAETYKQRGYPFLLGKDVLERASIEQWLRHEEHAFDPPSRALFCHLAFPLHDEDDDNINREKRKLEEVLAVYEQRLGESEFLAGNKFTLADLAHLPNTHHIVTSEKFAYLYDSRKNVQRWWNTISARDSWQQVLRDMKSVKEQYQMEEYEQQQQQWRKEPPPTYGGSNIRIDSRAHTGTVSQKILVPPPSTGFIAKPASVMAHDDHGATEPQKSPSSNEQEPAPPVPIQSPTTSAGRDDDLAQLFTIDQWRHKPALPSPIQQLSPGAPSIDEVAKTASVGRRAPTSTPKQTPTDARNALAPVQGAAPSADGISDEQSDKSIMDERVPELTPSSDTLRTSASIQEAIRVPHGPSDDMLGKTSGTDQIATPAASKQTPAREEVPDVRDTSDDTTKQPAVDTKAAPTPPTQEPVSSSQQTTEQIKGVAPTSNGIAGDESAKIAMADESATPPAPASDGRVASTALKGGILDARIKNEAVASVADPRGMPTTPRRPASTPDTQRRTTPGKVASTERKFSQSDEMVSQAAMRMHGQQRLAGNKGALNS